MDIEIVEESPAALAEYGRVSIAFEVRSVFDVRHQNNGLTLTERTVEVPYVKDYGDPARSVSTFDLSKWGWIAARSGGRRAGSAMVAYNTSGVIMLDGRSDLAVLWDIRVAPEVRGRGVGSALARAVERWAMSRGCRQIKVETQNVNVPACLFYQRQGFVLTDVHRHAYPELPDEIQLLWYKDIR
jgi:ribosomal protein S18 acetylase RimI-like enzyme